MGQCALESRCAAAFTRKRKRLLGYQAAGFGVSGPGEQLGERLAVINAVI